MSQLNEGNLLLITVRLCILQTVSYMVSMAAFLPVCILQIQFHDRDVHDHEPAL